MAMDLETAAGYVLLGQPLASLAEEFRQELIGDMGLGGDDVTVETFCGETERFMARLCRHLGDEHSEDVRVAAALQPWCMRVESYEAFDVLLAGYRFEGREMYVRRGKMLFPGTLTAHWED